MNLTDNETLKFLKGGPVFLDDICAVYEVTMEEIVDIGYTTFQQYLSVLTASKPTKSKEDNEFNELLDSLSDFQYLLFLVSIDPQMNSLVKAAFRFFTHSNATFSFDPPSIVLGPLEEKCILEF